MYFWNIDKLNKDLDTGLTEKENLKYLFAWSIIGLAWFSMTNTSELYEFLELAVSWLISLIGIIILYHINGWDNWKDFLSRYFSITFVAFIRWLVFILLPISIIYGIILGIIHGDDIPTIATIYDVIFITLYSLWLLYLNVKYFRALIKKK